MVYRRNRRFRKGRSRTRGGSRWGKYGYASLAKTAFKTAKWVASVINVETKMNSVVSDASGVALAATASIVPLTLTATGTTDITRNGNSIKAKSNSFKFNVKLNSSTPTSSSCRLMLVLDRASNGTTPLISDILDSDGNTPDTLEHYNPDNAGSRFKIMWDRRFTIDPNGRAQYGGSSYLRLRHHVKYSDTTANIASATTGHLFLVYMSDQSQHYPQMYYTNRFYFIDN